MLKSSMPKENDKRPCPHNNDHPCDGTQTYTLNRAVSKAGYGTARGEDTSNPAVRAGWDCDKFSDHFDPE
jgi:hypothetical protein